MSPSPEAVDNRMPAGALVTSVTTMTNISGSPKEFTLARPADVRASERADGVIALVAVIPAVTPILSSWPKFAFAYMCAIFIVWRTGWLIARSTPGWSHLRRGISVQPLAGPGRISKWSTVRRVGVELGVPLALLAPPFLIGLGHDSSDEGLGEIVRPIVLVPAAVMVVWTVLDRWQRLHDRAAGLVLVQPLDR